MQRKKKKKHTENHCKLNVKLYHMCRSEFDEERERERMIGKRVKEFWFAKTHFT